MTSTGGDDDVRARHIQSKLVQSKINDVEKGLGLLCQIVASYTRKTAKLRDRGDYLASTVYSYAEKESPSTKAGLQSFAKSLSAIQDYRTALIQRLESKVVEPLTFYGTECKHAKDDLRNTLSTRNKELSHQRKFDRVQYQSPSDQHQISQAKSKLQRAAIESTRSSKAIEDQMDNFERKKIEDIKTIMGEFVQVEMLFHSKALEVYTQAYQHLMSINNEDAIEEFRTTLRMP